MSYERLLEFVHSLEIIDTHEHLPAFEKERRADTDVLAEYLKHYISSDLVSAGLSDEALAFARDASKPLAKRWETVAPFWDASRNTGYARALDLSVRLIYGIERIDGKTLGRLNEAFLDAVRRGGHYDRVLRKEEATAAVVQYVLANPVRAGLAQSIGEWPFCGSDVT